jgi:hypothetical protein
MASFPCADLSFHEVAMGGSLVGAISARSAVILSLGLEHMDRFRLIEGLKEEELELLCHPIGGWKKMQQMVEDSVVNRWCFESGLPTRGINEEFEHEVTHDNALSMFSKTDSIWGIQLWKNGFRLNPMFPPLDLETISFRSLFTFASLETVVDPCFPSVIFNAIDTVHSHLVQYGFASTTDVCKTSPVLALIIPPMTMRDQTVQESIWMNVSFAVSSGWNVILLKEVKASIMAHRFPGCFFLITPDGVKQLLESQDDVDCIHRNAIVLLTYDPHHLTTDCKWTKWHIRCDFLILFSFFLVFMSRFNWNHLIIWAEQYTSTTCDAWDFLHQTLPQHFLSVLFISS